MLMISKKLGLDVHFKVDWHLRLQQAINATVVFDGHHDDGQWIGILTLVDSPAKACPAVVEDGAAGAAVVPPIAAGSDDRERVLGRQELSHLPAQLEPLHELLLKILSPRAGGILGQLLE